MTSVIILQGLIIEEVYVFPNDEDMSVVIDFALNKGNEYFDTEEPFTDFEKMEEYMYNESSKDIEIRIQDCIVVDTEKKSTSN